MLGKFPAGVPRDIFTEVAVLKVARFLRVIQWAILLLFGDD
jgi:hypothetical protein